MKRFFATVGIALALLLSACATGHCANGSTDGGLHFERQDIIQEMKR